MVENKDASPTSKSFRSSVLRVLFGRDDDKLRLFFLKGLLFILVLLVYGTCYYSMSLSEADRANDEDRWTMEVVRLLNYIVFLLLVACSFTYVRIVGLTTWIKVVFMCYPFVFFCLDWINSTHPRMFHMINLSLGIAPTLGNDQDAPLLKRVALIELATFLGVISLECFDLSLGSRSGLQLHFPWVRDEDEGNQWGLIWFSHVVPALFFSVMLQSYAGIVRKQEKQALHTVSVAFSIADKLANYDLEGAEELLTQTDYLGIGDVNMKKPFNQLFRNLSTYKPFVPTSLFKTDNGPTGNGESTPNKKLCNMLKGKETSWEHVARAVDRMQDLNYALRDFHEDMTRAFPELNLYFEKEDQVDNGSTWMSSGMTAADEFERTLGALYSVYCFLRIDIDGKEVFAYGIDEQGHPRRSPVGADSEKKKIFYDAMPWHTVGEILCRADLLEKDKDGMPILKKERVTAMLTLTAIHDVMKNTTLLPVVQKKHAPYRGYTVGDQIGDHDVALEYILEKYPTLLPSFRYLQPRQRAPILFTQAKMCFNNGWLVQGEAPPGALFSKFKQVISEGCVSQSDINFYFVHWLTDLAGAEPFGGKAWPGAEKLSARFPVKVLSRFLESFGYVDHLATQSEVQVMERYLFDRWANYGPFVLEHPECEVCAMRLALMAQGFEAEAVASFQGLADADRKTLAEEMAYTGTKDQFSKAPQGVKSDPVGPALLIYYAPALLQKAKSAKCRDALCVLAAVFRASRKLFPLNKACAEETVIIRIDVLKVLDPEEIISGAPWHVKRTSAVDAEAAPGWGCGDKCAPIVLSGCDRTLQISL